MLFHLGWPAPLASTPYHSRARLPHRSVSRQANLHFHGLSLPLPPHLYTYARPTPLTAVLRPPERRNTQREAQRRKARSLRLTARRGQHTDLRNLQPGGGEPAWRP